MSIRPAPLLVLPLVALALALAAPAAASPTAPVTVTLPPTGQGDAFIPGTRMVADLEGSYVEEEFFVSGEATLFNYANDPPLGPTDIVPIATDQAYTTRIVVRRPPNAAAFNGTVIVEWWNSTAGFDTAPSWDVSAEYFVREGAIYVGVTNSTTSIDFLLNGCVLFGLTAPTCATRYSVLDIPENGVAFEMVSQIANLLKSDSSENPIPGDYDVRRLYHVGQSQQGGSLVTYASAFHFDVNDGYFIQQAATARPINFGTSCNEAGAPAFPDCTPRLVSPDNLVRTDLPVPVVHAISETDIEVLFGIVGRQPDTPTFRYYEIAGGSHLTVHEGIELLPGLLMLEDLCLNQINSTGDGPVFVSYIFNALWDNLERQVRNGRQPPAGVLMDVVNDVVQRDANGNGLGGIRPPSLTAPVATYTPGNVADPNLSPFLVNIGNLACRLASSVAPFDQATLDALYPNEGDLLAATRDAANQLRLDGFLLREDRNTIVVALGGLPVSCGIGFEISLMLLPILAARRMRKRRTDG